MIPKDSSGAASAPPRCIGTDSVHVPLARFTDVTSMPHPSDPYCSGLLPDPSHLPVLTASVDAVLLIIRLSARFGPLMFHHDDSADPMQPRCRPVGSLKVGGDDIKLGEISGCEYWIDPLALEHLGPGGLLLDVLADGRDATGLAGRFILRKIGH